MADEPQSEEQQARLRISVPESQRGGVWSNFARVSHSEHEFTIDFVRIDYTSANEGTVDGIVVGRIGLSPLFVSQLIEALQDNWSTYAKKAMPKEVYGGDDPPKRTD